MRVADNERQTREESENMSDPGRAKTREIERRCPAVTENEWNSEETGRTGVEILNQKDVSTLDDVADGCGNGLFKGVL